MFWDLRIEEEMDTSGTPVLVYLGVAVMAVLEVYQKWIFLSSFF